MISISPNNNGHPAFTSGITRKLSRNYCSCEDDVIEILNKHPQKNGIAGQLPISWIEKLNASEFVNNKREIIKDIYQQFASIVKLASENIIEASDKLTEILRNYKILTNKQSYNIKKINTSGATYIENGYILEGSNGARSLFIKEFKDLSGMEPRRYKIHTKRDGKYIELARALQLNNQIKDRHIMHTNWGDTKNRYMVSEYVKPLKRYKSKIEIKQSYNNEKELIEDLNKKYGFRYYEIKNNNVKIGYEYENKFYSYPEERIIYNYFFNLLEKQNLAHYDLMDNPYNYIVTKDKNGNPLLKLIDFGGIAKPR